jgi:hypothetical protein
MMVSLPGSSFNLIVTARFTGLLMQGIGLARATKQSHPTKSKDKTAKSSDEDNTTPEESQSVMAQSSDEEDTTWEERQFVISKMASYLPDRID